MQTEDEIIANIPETVTLGEKKYPVKAPAIGKAMEWRKTFGPRLAPVWASSGANAATPEQFMVAFVESAQLMVDVVFGYMPDLPQDLIMETATERQMFNAFTTIMGLAFGPFLGEVAFLTGFKREMDKVTSRASEPSSNVQ